MSYLVGAAVDVVLNSPRLKRSTFGSGAPFAVLMYCQEDFKKFLSIFESQGISCETLFQKVDQYILGRKLPFDQEIGGCAPAARRIPRRGIGGPSLKQSSYFKKLRSRSPQGFW